MGEMRFFYEMPASFGRKKDCTKKLVGHLCTNICHLYTHISWFVVTRKLCTANQRKFNLTLILLCRVGQDKNLAGRALKSIWPV